MTCSLPKFPAGWNVLQLRRVFCDLDGIRIGPFGSALTLNQMVAEGYKVYGQENVISRDFNAGNRFIGPEKYKDLKVCAINPGDLLVTMMGTTGRCCEVPEDIETGIMDSHLIRLRFRPEDVVPSYMALLIDKAHYIKEQINANGKGTIMSGLNSAIMKEMWIGLPDVYAQRRIIKYIDDQTAKIDRLMEMRRRQIALLQEQRAAMIQQVVTRGLNPDAPMKDSGVSWLGEIPAHWELIRMKMLAESLIAGPFGSSITKDMYVSSGYRVYGQEQVIPANFSVGDYFITHKKYLEMARYAVIPGDVLISCVGSYGKVAVVPPDIHPGIINPRLLRLRPAKEQVQPEYLGTVLRSDVGFTQMSKEGRGGTMDVINIGLLAQLILPLPPKNEQAAILEFITEQDVRLQALHNAYAHQLDLLTEYRNALIHECVTGQREVPDMPPTHAEEAHAL